MATSEIRDGTVDASTHDYVGAIVGPDGLCSGTLLTPRVVLTAAHCVIGLDYRPFGIEDVLFSNRSDLLEAQAGTGVTTVERVVVAPEAPSELANGLGRGQINAGDVALLLLSDPIAVSTHPQLAQRNPFEPVIGPAHPSDAEAVLVGYGQSATGVGAGTRRTGDAVFAREEVGLPVYRFAPGATNQISCSGDSGGAALRGNVIGGVSHAGPGPCSTRDHSFYTAVAPYANWIAGTRDALESGTAGVSSWTNPASRYDVNANGHITAGDALLIINQLAREVSRTLARDVHGLPPSTHYWDVNGNGSISSSDALAVINQLARQGGSGPIGFDNSRAIFQPDAGTVASAAFRRDRAAIAAAYQDTAREVDAALGLHLRRSYFENWGGQGKKWVRGNTYWYFIEPDGFVYRYTLYSDGIAFGEIVAYLNDDYWRNPALLHDAQ